MVPSKQRSVLITGCSEGGIGDALAQAFHARGLRVFATARDLSKVSHLQKLGLTILELEVTSESSIKDCVSSVTKLTGGTLDILVNNSGSGYSSPILDVDINQAKKIMDVNFFGRVAVTQGFAPLVIKSKGIILNIGSIGSACPSLWSAMYGATCAAVDQWNNVLRLELEPFGVRVVIVSLCFNSTVEQTLITNRSSPGL